MKKPSQLSIWARLERKIEDPSLPWKTTGSIFEKAPCVWVRTLIHRLTFDPTGGCFLALTLDSLLVNLTKIWVSADLILFCLAILIFKSNQEGTRNLFTSSRVKVLPMRHFLTMTPGPPCPVHFSALCALTEAYAGPRIPYTINLLPQSQLHAGGDDRCPVSHAHVPEVISLSPGRKNYMYIDRPLWK